MKRLLIAAIALCLGAVGVRADVTSMVTFPAGTNGDVQFNKNRRFGADTDGDFTYSTATKTLAVQKIEISTLSAQGQTYTFPTSQTGGYFLKTDGAGGLTWDTPSSFFSSTGVALGVSDGGVVISTPTSNIDHHGDQFIVSLVGTTTAFVALNPSTVTLLGPTIDLASEVTGSLPASSIAAGSLGASVMASSVAVNSVLDPSIVSVTGSKVSGNIPGNAAGITGTVNVSQVVGAVSVYAATATASFPYGFNGSTFALSASNSSISSMTVTGIGGLRVNYGLSATTATVTGSTVSINGVTYYFPSNGGTSGQTLSTSGGATISTLTWSSAGAGDITSVTTGYGLVGGALSGDISLALDPNTTSFIHARSTLQSGATFYVSSGTVSGQLSVTSIRYADGTIQVSSPTAGGGGSSSGGSGLVQISDGAGGFTSDAGFTYSGSQLVAGMLDVSGGSARVIGVNSLEGLTGDDLLVGASAGQSASIYGGNGIGDTTKRVHISSSGAVQFPRFTPSERNALTALEADLIYNTTSNTFQYYNAATWSELLISTNALQTGTTFFVSSGTVSTLNLASGGYLKSLNASGTTTYFDLGGGGLGQGLYVRTGADTIAGTPHVQFNERTLTLNQAVAGAASFPSLNMCNGGSCTSLYAVTADYGSPLPGWYFNGVPNTGAGDLFVGVGSVTVRAADFSVNNNIRLPGNLFISSTTHLSGSPGTNGQVYTSGGPGAIPSWTTIAGSGDMILASTQTVTGKKTFTSQTAFDGAVEVSTSIVISGSPGTSGQFLTSGGPGSAPTWTTASGTGDAILASSQTWSGINTYTSTQGLKLVPNSNTGANAGTSGAFLLDCTYATHGICSQTYRNDPVTPNTASALQFLLNDSTSYANNMLWIKSNSTSTLGGNADINIHANNPDIEFRELDYYNGSDGVGQWELALNFDNLQVNARNSTNTSFQTLVSWDRDDGQKFKEMDGNDDYVAIRATTTQSGSYAIVIPDTAPSTNEVLKATGQGPNSEYNLTWDSIATSELSGQISDTQIADGAVDGGTGGEIADGSITAADLGTDSVSTDEIAADAVSASELNATGVESELEAVLDLDQLQGQISDTQIADGAVDGGTGGEIADASITAADLAADSVDASELASTAIQSGDIEAGDLPSDGYASTYVNTTGDTMTGQLTVFGSSLTVSYAVAAGSVTASSATIGGQFTAGTYQGGSLATCGDSTHALSWSGGSFGCQEITVPAGTGDNLGSGTGSYGVATTTAGFTGQVTVSSHVVVTSSNSVPAVKITANGVYGATAGTSGGLLLDCTGGSTATGMCAQIYSNAGAQGATGPLLYVRADNTAFNQPLIYATQDGTSGGAANIRLDGPAPQIELVENDQSTPAGKYEMGVNGDIYYVAGRNGADDAFDIFWRAVRKDVSGGGYVANLSSVPYRFYDGDSSNYVSIGSSQTVASNVRFTLPEADGTAAQVLHTDGNGGWYFAADDTGGGGSSGPVSLSTGVTGGYEKLLPQQAEFLTTNFPQVMVSTFTSFGVRSLCYDASTSTETATWVFNADTYTSGNLTVNLYWYAASATSGDVMWSANIAAITPNTDSGQLFTESPGAYDTATDSHLGTNASRVHHVALTLSTLDSLAADDLVYLSIGRAGTNSADSMTGDACLVYASVTY